METDAARDEETPALPEEPMPDEGVELEPIRDFAPVATRGLPTDNEIRRMWRIANALHTSGMFKGSVEKAEEAFAKIVVGHDLGLTPAQSMTGIHIVQGSPMLHYTTLGHFLRQHGYDFRKVEHDDEKCTLRFFARDGSLLGDTTFTMEDAKALGVKFAGKSGQPTMWKKRPRIMLFSRALSEGARQYVPEAFGGIPIYSEGEIVPESRRIAGTGEPEGIELGPKVEAVLIRAKSLGHEGIADRGAAEMALGDQPPQIVDRWCEAMHAELDKIDPEKQEEKPDAEPEEKGDEEGGAVTGKPCGEPDPTREGVTCEKLAGHDGMHYADEQEWQAFTE